MNSFGVNLDQLNRISDPNDPYSLDDAANEAAMTRITRPDAAPPPVPSPPRDATALSPTVPPPAGEPYDTRGVAWALVGAQEPRRQQAFYALRNSKPEQPADATGFAPEPVSAMQTIASGSAQGLPNTVQMWPSRPGDYERIEKMRKERGLRERRPR